MCGVSQVSALLLLWLLGAEPNQPMFYRLVGPILTDESCLFTKPPNDLVAHWGRKVCVEHQVVDAECFVQLNIKGGERPCVLSYKRWCWCAEQESK